MGGAYRSGFCSECICRFCLMWWSGRCKYGKCYDDRRAFLDPYTDHHPERHLWSKSHEPGEQDHWCRGGSLYVAEDCEHFVQYEGQKIEQCHKASISVFQDGYRTCSMMVNGSCEICLSEMEAEINGCRKS